MRLRLRRDVLEVLDDKAIVDVAETDYGIYRTPDGELYNDDMLASMNTSMLLVFFARAKMFVALNGVESYFECARSDQTAGHGNSQYEAHQQALLYVALMIYFAPPEMQPLMVWCGIRCEQSS